MRVWKKILKIGCSPQLQGPERNSVMIVNGVSVAMTGIVSFFMIYYVATGVSIWANWLPAYPLFAGVLYLHAKRKHQVARATFFWGSLLLIGVWCFTNRRNGAEYGLIVLGITSSLIFQRNKTVYLASFATALVFITYEITDSLMEFNPNPTFNYDVTPKLILGVSIAVVFFEIMIFRSLARRYYRKLSKKFSEVHAALSTQKMTEAELQVANEELMAANEALNNLTEQLDLMVRQKSIELQSYLDAINVQLYSAVTDVNGRILSVNEPLLKVAGYSREELVGGNFRILNSGHHPQEFYQTLYDCILKGRTWRGEIRNKAKNGSYFWIDQVILPVKNSANELTSFLMIALPITERKEIEEERAKTMQMLESIAHRASHELRAPLARILGLTYLLSHEMIRDGELNWVTSRIILSSQELDEATKALTVFVNGHHQSMDEVRAEQNNGIN